jgi:hypothetical protein
MFKNLRLQMLADTIRDMTSTEKANLYLQHPEEDPEPVGVRNYLIHPPSKLSSTARWIEFRDKTLLPLNRDRPEDVYIQNFLNQVAIILAWRDGVPQEDRFWRAD